MIPESIIGPLSRVALFFIPAVIGIVCHEVAHGWVAYRLGDPTAKAQGRLTLNPVRHVDPMGLGVFVFTAFFTSFAIGWAKPVPVNSGYFKNSKSGMMIVAIAGPLTNFMLALAFALVLKLLLSTISPYDQQVSPSTMVLMSIASMGVLINCMLGIFNLFPIPPLDGSHILTGLLPDELAKAYWGLGRYSMLLVIGLLATGVFGAIIWPLLLFVIKPICFIAGVNPNLLFSIMQNAQEILSVIIQNALS